MGTGPLVAFTAEVIGSSVVFTLRRVRVSRRPDQVKNPTVWGSALPSSDQLLRPASGPSLLGEPISILA